ncbi:DUF1102 domain-containing protein [Thermococcus sp. 5-4]|uniref:DUF1102 domain-containing protein n=1 Tax=Thermococcus sp. 5-4 TaxID=2008440 RepID=UPI000B4A1402|nr:DUF1102 domain-containing protein [Thermococcus sp. 5-4]ASA76801.1 hypothetical protein CDI07_00300 [Thermococcus sp. 5-4]
MKIVNNILIGMGLVIILLIGIGTIYPNDALQVVVYGAPNQAISLETPLPPYAHPSNGVLKVDITNRSPFYPGFGNGLSRDSVYVFDDVFTITNNESETGYSKICVTLISQTAWISFFEGNFNGNWTQTLEIEITANETLHVGMRFDTHDVELGEHATSIQITAVGGSCE